MLFAPPAGMTPSHDRDSAPLQVFVNPNARDGAVDRLHGAVQRILGDQVGIVQSNSPEDAVEAVHAACRDGRTVVASGGDGTVHAIVNAMMQSGRPSPLGLIASGTSNNFCRDLDLPLEVNAALEVVRDGAAEPIDLMRIDADGVEHYCTTVATAGNADRVIEALEDADKEQWGAWCYLRAALPVMADLEGFDVDVSIDGGLATPFRLWNMIVANGRYAGGGLDVAPRARLDDGLLDLILIAEGEAVDLAGLATDFLLSDYLEHPRVTYRQARSVEVRSNDELKFLADGEMISGKTFRFEAAPDALSVVLPSQSG